MKVMAIGGSPRLDGNTNYLIDQTFRELVSQGVETEKIVLSQYNMNPCQGHDNCSSFSECSQKNDAAWILDKFRKADGVILASPVYYYNISAQMKTFMDRNYFLYTHNREAKAKCAGLKAVGGGEGADETIEALKNMFKFSETRIFSVTGYADKSGAIKSQVEVVQRARNMGRQMAEILTDNV